MRPAVPDHQLSTLRRPAQASSLSARLVMPLPIQLTRPDWTALIHPARAMSGFAESSTFIVPDPAFSSQPG